ncbi:uncharacterized protein LOC114538973 [Dendronephthya gigantea]|uniref:uncharacterized protein LOC114538973 n=1 Tax=Dendronephthya gigantea TaxID=151771 RepID=UPI00106A0469|nr:uncharacterized protein LOC114538973 [Dendronephthya gigantea]
MFNKRRGGEASRMKLDAFQGRPLWGNIHNEEIVSALSATERELCKRFDMVEILGKRNRKVPVLLTPDVKAAILVLNRTREDGNVNEENPYVFAVNDGSSKQFLRGNDVIRHACKMVDLKNPDVITSTNLRKYVATVSQLVDMDQNELGWLATHLGHDVHIHKEFYRMQESTLEMAVVGNLLMAIDEGRAHEFKGKNLRDITLQDFHNTQSEEDAESELDKENRFPQSNITSPSLTSAGKRTTTKKGTNKSTEKSKKHCNKKRGTLEAGQQRKMVAKKTWTTPERKAALKTFQKHIQNGVLPKKNECVKFLEENHGIVQNRTWTNVKDYVRNYTVKKKLL